MSVRTLSRVWDCSRHAGNDLLMLLAIADFADDDGRAYPAVATLAEKCRMSPRNANKVIAVLRKGGELEVRQNEGPKGTNLYRIVLDNLAPLSERTPCPNGHPVRTDTLSERTAPPVKTDPKPLSKRTDEPSVNRQEPSTSPPAVVQQTKFNPLAHLVDLEVPEEIAGDWLTLRKQHKAPATKTAIDGIAREATKAGISLADALRHCCTRGWRGFKAEWLSSAAGAAGRSPAPNNQFLGAL